MDKSFWDAIPWIVAIVGWACTHLFSEARERRKETRSQLDKAYEQLQNLEEEARAFHCSANFDDAKSVELISKISTLERTFKRISLVEQKELDPLIVQLRRSITLDNFEKSCFHSQQASSRILMDISFSAQEIEDRLESKYAARYPNSFPYFDWS